MEEPNTGLPLLGVDPNHNFNYIRVDILGRAIISKEDRDLLEAINKKLDNLEKILLEMNEGKLNGRE